MKVVNCEVVMSTTVDGQIKLEPVTVLEELIVENLVNRTDIPDNFLYEINFSNDEKCAPMTFKQLKEYARVMPKEITSTNEYTDDFAQFFTEEEFEKIKNGNIVLFQASDRILMVAATD